MPDRAFAVMLGRECIVDFGDSHIVEIAFAVVLARECLWHFAKTQIVNTAIRGSKDRIDVFEAPETSALIQQGELRRCRVAAWVCLVGASSTALGR